MLSAAELGAVRTPMDEPALGMVAREAEVSITFPMDHPPTMYSPKLCVRWRPMRLRLPGTVLEAAECRMCE